MPCNTVDDIFSGNCTQAEYDALHGGTPTGGIPIYDSGSDPNYGGDNNVNYYPTYIPPVDNTTNGNNELNTILDDVLSSLAIFRGAKYVPTTVQPVNQYGGYAAGTINPATGIPYTPLVNTNIGTGANIGATVEDFIKNNTGILLLAGAAFLLLQMKPVSRR